jgi:hypothetical protein
MPINPTQLTSIPITDNLDVTVEFLVSRPSTTVYQSTPNTPNKLFAYYDSIADYVELYVVDKSGYRYLRVG